MDTDLPRITPGNPFLDQVSNPLRNQCQKSSLLLSILDVYPLIDLNWVSDIIECLQYLAVTAAQKLVYGLVYQSPAYQSSFPVTVTGGGRCDLQQLAISCQATFLLDRSAQFSMLG
ncbi:hypothetical protein VNO77_44038 [Canavalia gladiata]|uniref:Uncharacterized protein n=1 Tax=Canavalia gladiata TaxID=3824 RepID=A0AAN9JXJ2_CANGL